MSHWEETPVQTEGQMEGLHLQTGLGIDRAIILQHKWKYSQTEQAQELSIEVYYYQHEYKDALSYVSSRLTSEQHEDRITKQQYLWKSCSSSPGGKGGLSSQLELPPLRPNSG